MLLITGSHGQLGIELLKVLPSAFAPNAYELDITDALAVNSFIKEHQIEVVINCAAYTAVDMAEDEREKCFRINVLGVENLVKTGVKIIQISTDYVFNGMGHKPYVETDIPCPLSYYGKTKLDAENVLLQQAKSYFIVRTSWLYSPHRNNFVKTMMRLSQKQEQISVVVDQIGTPTSAQDLANAISLMLPSLKEGVREIYHFSNEGVCSWYDFACAIMEMSQSSCKIVPIETKEYPTKAMRPFYSVLNKAKIKRDFSFEISHWRDSLKRMFS